MTKKTLFDLYVTSKEFVVKDEESGIEVPVLLRKMNSIQQSKAQRAANGARAAVLALQRDAGSERRAEYENGIVDSYSTREDRINFLAALEMSKKSDITRAKIASQDKWNDDDYLDGLQEAWEDLKFDWADPETRSEESERVHDALKEFEREVQEALDPIRKREARDLEKLSDEELHRRMVDHQLKNEADIAWLLEYRMQMLFYCVYDPETKQPYFSARKDIDLLPNAAMEQLMMGINNLTVEITEGKDSEEVQDS